MRRVFARGFWLLGFVGLVGYIERAALHHFYDLNGDHVIQIMMAKHFSWQSVDFYYWGQNRLGSLLPILLIAPIQLLHWPALPSAVVCSLLLYLVALAVLFAYARTTSERIAALLSFGLVPIGCYKFLLYTGHPYVPVFALTLLGFAWAFRAPLTLTAAFGVGLLYSTALWVSETALAALVPLLLLLWERRHRLQLTWAKLALLALGGLTFLPAIVYWRRQIGYVGHEAEYLDVATPHLLALGLERFLPQFSLLLNSELPGESVAARVAALGLIAIHGVVLALRNTRAIGESHTQPRAPILTFLALHDVCYFALVLLSAHSYFGQGKIQRYWVPVALFSIHLLCVVTVRVVRCWGTWSRALVLAVPALACAVSLVVLASTRFPQFSGPHSALRSMERYQRDLAHVRARGATHVTGNYWRVLPLNVLSEFHVLAVPRGYARTTRFAREFSRSARRQNPRDFLDF